MIDVLRSVTRATSRALGEEWEVGQSSEAAFARPYCKVTPSTPISSVPHGPRCVDRTQGYAIHAFPVSFPVTTEAAMTEAMRVERLLLDAFTAGIETEHYHGGRRHPMRIPLHSYQDVPPGQSAGALAGFLKVRDVSVGALADPADDNVFVVIADLRVAWNESITLEPGPLVQTVTVEAGP